MKKITTTLVAILIALTVFAQAPEMFSYQAVIRNSNNDLVTNQNIGMQISILQGSVNGTSVYIETHSISTNTNGLVSLEIGTGNVQSGDFTNIDWAGDTFFIKTETDLTGGSDYTITGTSQLLSVPYAMHAKTAESVTGTITETDPVYSEWDKSSGISITESQITDFGSYVESETDPVFTNSHAANISDADITKLNNLSGINTGDQDISGIGVNAQAIQDTATNLRTDLASKNNVLTLNNTTEFTPSSNYQPATKKYVDDNSGSSSTTYSIGDFVYGGIVIWVDETGQHGIVCAIEDQNMAGTEWHAGTDGSTHAKGDGPYSGRMNTSIIIAAHVAIGDDGNPYAARVCNEYTSTVGDKSYGDWYLPSKEELNYIYQNKDIVETVSIQQGGSGFANAPYWSSTEKWSDDAWLQYFSGGTQEYDFKSKDARVRAVRKF